MAGYDIYGGKDPRNIMRGRQSRAQGEIFEQIIMASCEHYREIGIAHIEKTPEPFHVTKSCGNGKFIGNFAKQAQPDFKGTLINGGAVVFEAKHTDGDRITQDRVTPEQSEALNLHELFNAFCFVFVSFGMKNFYRVPWYEWKQMKEKYGRKYITENDTPGVRCRFDGRAIHFLRGLEDTL